MLKHALLGLLANQPRHGYDLKHTLENALGGHWEINFGQIYTTLNRLERDGLVTSVVDTRDRRVKRIYSITHQGCEELDAWLVEPVEKKRQLRDEFFVRLFVRQLARRGDTSATISRQRQAYRQQLRDMTAMAAGSRDDPYVSLLLEGAMLHLQADLQWLDLCDEHLEETDSRAEAGDVA